MSDWSNHFVYQVLDALDQRASHREALLSMLQRLGGEPVVNLTLPRPKLPARVLLPKRFETEPVGKANPTATHSSFRMIDPSRFRDSESDTGAASAFQNASCSTAVIDRVCSRAERVGCHVVGTPTLARTTLVRTGRSTDHVAPNVVLQTLMQSLQSS